MKWITWENIGIDRMSSSWLIKKHVDPEAEFVFIKKGSDYKDVEGIPFDIPGAALSHKRGKCTFCTIIKEYGINDPVIDQMAEIVNAADTINDLLPPPESAGIDLVCRGVSKFLKNDAKAVEAGFVIFEAVYTQLKDQS
ncbi:MAG: hypothetical protein C4518_08205 [Desulfobacteraceae bacterium]|nr:MAG: hypothetical protein C4518_08205 [Desulfobacteraceae bacterium]